MSLLASPGVGSIYPLKRGWWGRKQHNPPEFSLTRDQLTTKYLAPNARPRPRTLGETRS